MLGLGMPELLVIFFIIFLLFGAKKLPEIARSLGRAVNEFKNPPPEKEKQEEPDSGKNTGDIG